jgi:nucleoside-diphosphate-sugar epimerase
MGNMVARDSKTVFLTGASGVLGQALLQKVPDVRVICLTRRKPITGPNIRSLPGDVATPYFGLTSREFEDLARRTDYIVHSAANTNFSLPDKLLFATNVDGTRNVLELAARARVPVCHISTAFAYSDDYASGHRQAPAYERSKLESERIVRESGVPHVIIRPSVIIGDSTTGAMDHFQGFHFLMDLTVRGMLPVPSAASALVDFVPQDLVADVVAALIRRNDVRGEYWVTAGAQALCLERIVTVWAEHVSRVTGAAYKRPRFVDPDIIERLILPVILPALPPELQVQMRGALQMAKYFNMTRPFPSSLVELAALLGTPALPDSEVTLARNAEYWAATSDQLPSPLAVSQRA